MIYFYTIGCPACNVLEKKLNSKHIEYEAITDKDKMIKMGMEQFPMMAIDDGPLMSYTESVAWVNAQEA